MKSPALDFLEQIRSDLEYVDYQLIFKTIEQLESMFVPTAYIKKGSYIDRVRINRNGEVFSNVNQLSYISDKNILQKFVGYGRANEPNQAVFYGAVATSEIPLPRAVAYFETSESLKGDIISEDFEEIFTLSRWKVLEDIQIIEMIFDDEALRVNENCKISLENQLRNIKDQRFVDYYKKQGKFFSGEFARKDINNGESYKYKISAAYANFIWKHTNLKGVTYPSVQSNYLGQNIALLPEIVDSYLQIENIGMFRCGHDESGELVAESYKLATNIDSKSMDIQWIE